MADDVGFGSLWSRNLSSVSLRLFGFPQDEDALLREALAMSVAEAPAVAMDTAPDAAAVAMDTAADAPAAPLQDPAFLAAVLAGLPGVDLDDADVQSAIAALVGAGF